MQRISERRWLILLIETKVRELHAKMLLGLVAAEQGWGVLIGSKSAVRNVQSYLPRGTFLEKGVAPGTAETIERARTHGHRVSAVCEEGLLYFTPEDNRARRLDPRSMAAIDYFFAWGPRHAQDARNTLARDSQKVVISGNPRLDLVRPEWRGILDPAVQQIRERHGPIILLNTKFPTVNNIIRTIGDYTDYLKSVGRITSPDHEALWRRFIAVQKHVLPRMLDLVPALSRAFPGHAIVVRPHPSEDNAPWQEKARPLRNVKVIDQGNVLEWILAADVVIQNNCLTAVEAFLLDKPVIGYRPYQDDEAEFELPRRLGLQASTEAEVLSLIEAVVRREIDTAAGTSAQRELARQCIANMDGRLASDVIVETFETLDLPLAEGAFPLRPHGIGGSVARLKSLPVVKSMLTYNRKKFPSLSLAEMEGLRAGFQGISGRFLDVEIRQAADDVFCLYRP